MSVAQKIALPLILSLLAACTVPRPYERRGSTEPPQPSTVQSPSTVQTQPATPSESTTPSQPLPSSPSRRHVLSPPAKALVAQAQSQLKAGNEPLAAATLERALRIEPNNPLIWIEIAKVRQSEGNSSQAENTARKALAMSVGDTPAQAAAWRAIAESYRARGKAPEARDADAKASALSGG